MITSLLYFPFYLILQPLEMVTSWYPSALNTYLIGSSSNFSHLSRWSGLSPLLKWGVLMCSNASHHRKKKKKTPARSKNFVSLSLPLEEPPNVTAKSRIIFLFARNTSGFPHLETQLKLSPRCPQSFHVTANGHPSTLPSSSFWISFLSNCQKPDFLAPSSECSFHSWAATENLLCAC